MKILYWNARGIANADTKRALKSLVASHKPSFLCLSEPFVLVNSIPISFWRSMGLSLVTTNDRGDLDPNLWIFCHEALRPTVLSNTAQQVTFSCTMDGVSCAITAVYARTSLIGRRQLWQDLLVSYDQFVHGPWLVLGDFNCVLGAHEKRGGGPPNASYCNEFRLMYDSCNLIDIPTKGLSFTWCSRRTEVRLDRALGNLDWFASWTAMDCCTLTKATSDHCPILLSCSRLNSVARLPFLFQSMWL